MTRPTHTIRSWQQQLGSLSLCSRLTLLLLAVGLTPMVFSQVLAMKAYSDRILNHHLDATEQMASGKLEQLQALLTTKSLELDALAQALQQRPATLERDWAQQASQLGFDDLMLVDLTQRRVIAAALDPGLIGTSLDTEMLHDCGLNKVVAGMGPLNQLSVVPLSRDPCTEGMATWMAVPLQDPGKQNLLLAGRLDAASFRKVVDSRFARLNHDAEAHLVIEQRQGDERQFVAVPTGEAAASRPAVNFQPISRGGLDVADRQQGLGGASYLRAANGELMLGAWRLIPQSNVAVLVTIPEAEPRFDGQALNRQLLMLLAATAVLVTAAGVVLGRRLAGPIQKLHQAIQGFDPADETSLTPVLVSGHDEIATLASTINAMAQRIQERTSNLRETKEQLNAYIQTAQTTLLALDFEGRITLLNRSGCDLIGIPPMAGPASTGSPTWWTPKIRRYCATGWIRQLAPRCPPMARWTITSSPAIAAPA